MKQLIFILALITSFNVKALSEDEEMCGKLIYGISYTRFVEPVCGFKDNVLPNMNKLFNDLKCETILGIAKVSQIGSVASQDFSQKINIQGQEDFCKGAREQYDVFAKESLKYEKTIQSQSKHEPNTLIEQSVSWQGDWGSGITAIVSNQSCGDRELLSQGYNYLMTVSIPKARLKVSTDAWQIIGDRAITITGCWFKKPDNMIHAKLTKKKGNKTWEQDFKMDDGRWNVK